MMHLHPPHEGPPSRRTMMDATLTCPLCHHADHGVREACVRDQEYDAPGDYRWLECRACGLVRLDPMPSAAVLALAYPDHYHAYQEPASGLTRSLIHRSRAGLARRLAAEMPAGGTVLEIGCSSGELLAAIGALGTFTLLGVEYKPEMAARARAKGVTIWEGDFDAAEIPAETADLVIMQHVLEHVYAPLKTLAKVARLLKPGGRVVGELPNLCSWDARLFGRYWGGGHAPRHLWHFTPDTLRRSLEQSGLVVETLSPALNTGHWALSVQNALRRNRRNAADLVSGRAWYYPLLLVATIPINLLQMPGIHTGVMRFAARRPS